MKVFAKEDIIGFGYKWNIYKITPGKFYDADTSVVHYDPDTYEPKVYYIIRCDDGKTRKFDIDWFIPIDVWREEKLNKLGI